MAVPSATRALQRLFEPAGDDPVYRVLLRASRRHLHGMHDHTLLLMCLLALLSALLLPTGTFSFPIWYGIFAFYLIFPAAFLVRGIQRSGSAPLLLSAPLTSRDYARAAARFHGLCVAFAAVPYVVFWGAFWVLRPLHYPSWYGPSAGAGVAAFAAAWFVALAAWLWLTMWGFLAGGAAPVLSLLALAALMAQDELDDTYVFMRHLPDTRGVLYLLGLAAAMAVVGGVLARHVSRHFVRTAKARIFG
jgi:hypothetical protein